MMTLLLYEINKIESGKGYTVAKVWVKDENHEFSEDKAVKKLIDDGCTINSVIEITTTQQDDYFAPCTSLDAYMLAEREGIAVLYS